VEQTKNLDATREVVEREFPGHPGVRQHLTVLEEPYELRVTGAEVVDPDRRVDEGSRRHRLPPRDRLRVGLTSRQLR
jgi:hypothetical protein